MITARIIVTIINKTKIKIKALATKGQNYNIKNSISFSDVSAISKYMCDVKTC